jgi:hypothetical protein
VSNPYSATLVSVPPEDGSKGCGTLIWQKESLETSQTTSPGNRSRDEEQRCKYPSNGPPINSIVDSFLSLDACMACPLKMINFFNKVCGIRFFDRQSMRDWNGVQLVA